jgi:DNA-binding SARP family transcriptional activator
LIFYILGSLWVDSDGRSFTPTSFRQKTILAAMLLSENQPVSHERFTDLVWNGQPPTTARAQVNMCVSQLRRKLASIGLVESIQTVSPGYAMRVGDGELDLQVADRLVSVARAAAAEGRLAEASTAMRSAVQLWKGEPLAGINSPGLRAVATHLAERRVGMVEELMEYELTLGRYRDVADELGEFIRQHPMRERLQLLWMRALHAGGRRAEALRAYRSVHEQYVEELGLEPGVELQKLHRDILRGASPGGRLREASVA